MKLDTLYTIELANNEGRGRLYRQGSAIHCIRERDGKYWDTGVTVVADFDATIQAAWGDSVWDLREIAADGDRTEAEIDADRDQQFDETGEVLS